MSQSLHTAITGTELLKCNTKHAMECASQAENNHVAMETKNSDSDNGQHCYIKETVTSTNKNKDHSFKKPAIFAASSYSDKKSGASNSMKRPSEDPVSSVTKNKDHVKNDQSPAQPNDTKLNPTNCPSDERTEGQNPRVDYPKAKDIRPKVLAKLPPTGKFPPLPYTEPPWGCIPDVSYSLELLKNGTILDTLPLSHRSFFVVGRLPVCDSSLEHPSISRYHAVLQYRGRAGQDGEVREDRGFYVYDLGSTHGTFVNKSKIPPKTYVRVRVGHMLKFGGSTRLFILQGPDFDEEAESELTVTELREQARKQKEELVRRMTGDEVEEQSEASALRKSSSEDIGCLWGLDDDAMPEEDENEENPFATEFHEDQEAAYLKDPKKALQGFYDREGEELELEYEDKCHGTWLCRIKLPVDDAVGRQLVAEVTHLGKKKEAAIQCCLEACRILEARGLLRQEAVSRKRKKKNWEDEDFYDSDDDTFLDRTGAVERRRSERMKKAGKIQEYPNTYESLLTKMAEVEKELDDTEKKLSISGRGSSSSSSEDPLDVFMHDVQNETSLDGVERKKLHLRVAELKKEGQRLHKLVELTRPTQLPSLQPSGSSNKGMEKVKKLSLPMFGAMKGGTKFKLKTGTIGKQNLPAKRASLPPELLNMKEFPSGGEEEEEEEKEEETKHGNIENATTYGVMEVIQSAEMDGPEHAVGNYNSPETHAHGPKEKKDHMDQPSHEKQASTPQVMIHTPTAGCDSSLCNVQSSKTSMKKKVTGPNRPPVAMSKQYPDDNPDYCIWVPPAGQTGDGRTYLNDKYGY